MRSDGLRLSKVDFVYDRLRASIINGERQPGDVLDKSVLSREFSASRQPLASAIDRLERDGLVRIVPQHGSFVSKLDKQQIEGRLFVRRAIEVELVLAIAGKALPELIEQLDLNLRYQKVALDAHDYDSLYDLDQRFHTILHEVTANDEAVRVLERAKAYLNRVRRMMLPEAERAARTVSEHVAIRNALADGDVERAAAAMRQHMVAVEDHFKEFVIRQPALFESDGSAPTLGRKKNGSENQTRAGM